MPRRPRLSIAGIPWHIIQRGNNRSACFYHDDDYRYYLQALQEQSQKFHCAVHAYALMTNHVHLLLTPADEAGISKLNHSDTDGRGTRLVKSSRSFLPQQLTQCGFQILAVLSLQLAKALDDESLLDSGQNRFDHGGL